MPDEYSSPVAVLEAEHGRDARDPSTPPNRQNSELCAALYAILSEADLREDALLAEIECLKQAHANAVYSELIFLLSHLRFAPSVARDHWEQISAHRDSMAAALGRDVDFRVALTSYFLEVHRSLRSPKLIEINEFEEAQASIYHDELTGLRNYRFFNECLNQEVLRSQITGAPLSLVMIDVDDFKALNDSLGHEAGNRALIRVAQRLSLGLRAGDVLARFGGEEFVLVLASTPKHEAEAIAESMRHAVENAMMPEGHRLTVSMGLATSPADAADAGELLRSADRAMYEAKASGKNQLRRYHESTRSFARFESTLSGRFSVEGLEWLSMRTTTISQGGLQFETSSPVREKSLVDFELLLPGDRVPVQVVGRIIYVEGPSAEGCRAAVKFIDMPPDDRVRLITHLQSQPRTRPGNATHRGPTERRSLGG